MAGSLYRSKGRGFRTGDKFEMQGMHVEVLGVEGKTPWFTRFTFARSLDDPEYLFLQSTPDGIRPFKIPPVGAKLRLPPPERPHL